MRPLALILSLLPLTSQAAFTDVESSHPHAEAISYIEEQSIVKGYDNGEFRPQNNINRAEFTKIILESQFDKSTIYACDISQKSFSDVGYGDWFTPYVCLAKQKGIIGGYNNGTFGPGKNINFAEASKIITQSFNISTGDGTPWFAPFITALSEAKAIPLSITNAEKNITRGEMAELIYRLMTQNTTKESTKFDTTGNLLVETDISTEQNTQESTQEAEAVFDALDDEIDALESEFLDELNLDDDFFDF